MAVIAKPSAQSGVSRNFIISRWHLFVANLFGAKQDVVDNEIPAEAFDRMVDDIATPTPSSPKELEAIDALMKNSRF